MNARGRGGDGPSARKRGEFLQGVRWSDLRKFFSEDVRSLPHFYLDDEERSRLASMGRLRRGIWLLGWLLRGLLLKLAPARRVMLAVALLLAVLGPSRFQVSGVVVQADLRLWGFLLLLLILMLELKDKLVAREEIEIARQVQLALLPRTFPRIEGWEVWSYTRPANDVGGDLVDFVDAGDQRLAAVLGDVAGKGLGAALLMAKLQATLRAVAPECAGLDRMGTRLNTILCRDGLPNRFATLFYAEPYPGAGALRYLNAGHNPPYVIRADHVEPLSAGSLPLGMLPDSRYREGGTEMAPGDLLVIYSDGVTEARSPKGEEFGEERLKAILPGLRSSPPEEAGKRILRKVNAFLAEARPHDDMSLVLLRRIGA